MLNNLSHQHHLKTQSIHRLRALCLQIHLKSADPSLPIFQAGSNEDAVVLKNPPSQGWTLNVNLERVLWAKPDQSGLVGPAQKMKCLHWALQDYCWRDSFTCSSKKNWMFALNQAVTWEMKTGAISAVESLAVFFTSKSQGILLSRKSR